MVGGYFTYTVLLSAIDCYIILSPGQRCGETSRHLCNISYSEDSPLIKDFNTFPCPLYHSPSSANITSRIVFIVVCQSYYSIVLTTELRKQRTNHCVLNSTISHYNMPLTPSRGCRIKSWYFTSSTNKEFIAV